MSEEKVIREKHSQPSLVHTNCVLEFTHPRNSCSQCLLLVKTCKSTPLDLNVLKAYTFHCLGEWLSRRYELSTLDGSNFPVIL